MIGRSLTRRLELREDSLLPALVLRIISRRRGRQ